MANHHFKTLSLDNATSTSQDPSKPRSRQNSFPRLPIEDYPRNESAVVDEEDDDSSRDGDGLVMRGTTSHDSDMFRLRKELRARGTSIKFDPQAKLDDGHVHTLDTPLPGKPLHGEQLGNGHVGVHRPKHDGHHGHEAPALAIPIRQRPRRRSETDQEEFDSLTGQPLHGPNRNRGVYSKGEMRHPLLQTTVDELARERGFGAHIGEPPSLTSERTASPIMEQLQTPVNGNLLSPLTVSPIDFSSPAESKTLPSRRSVSQRSFGSLGSAGRRHTIKSNNSSLSSPARSFLSQWTRADDAVKEPDPDDEGQEIGDDSGYIIGRKIGFGGFSVVKEATTFENGQRVVRAVKIVRKQIKDKSEIENDELQSEFDREVGVWRYLKHPYILPLIAVYESSFATFCITKLNTGGTIFDLIRARRKRLPAGQRGLPVNLAKRYIYQLGSAIRYLHQDVRVVHRDIKPENCLLDMSGPGSETQGGTLLLCDFGMADFTHNEHRPQEHVEDSANNNGNVVNIGPAMTSTNIQGSLEYTAPELITAGRPMYSMPADIWAYGCVMYTMLTGSMPFTHEFQPRLILMIEKGVYDVNALRQSVAVKESGNDAAVDLVQRCLELNPTQRLSVSEVLEHPFLAGCKELYEPSDFS